MKNKSSKIGRFGMVHIPKTAGTSLSRVIHESLDLVPVHISRIITKKNNHTQKKTGGILKSSIAFKIACNSPYISGHIMFHELRKMRRQFIFTVMRDPRKRLISLFTYQCKRVKYGRVDPFHPDLGKSPDIGFYDYMRICRPNNGMNLLLRDMKGYQQIFKNYDGSNQERIGLDVTNLIEAGLKRYDVIYSCSIQEVLDDLASRKVIPKSEAAWINESDGEVNFGGMGSRVKFLDTINAAVWLDMLIYDAAKRLFPETMKIPIASDDEIIEYVESRYNLKFPS